MADPEIVEDMRRYLRQRLEAGETEVLLPRRAPAVPASADLAAQAAGAAGAVPATEVTGAAGITVAAVSPPDAAPGAAPFPTAAARATAPSAAPSSDTLEAIAAEIAACTRCPLHRERNRTVPGVGPATASVVFIGEGPGAEEDARGEPFVGRAGELLNKILGAIGFRRDEVYITNIVKCRPPLNRDPLPDEVAACEDYLKRQLAVLRPKVICALGRHAGSWLAGAPESMASLRTGTRYYQGIRVFNTYHPAALLRNPQWKRPTWEDVQRLRAEHDRLTGTP